MRRPRRIRVGCHGRHTTGNVVLLLVLVLRASAHTLSAQTTSPDTVPQQIERLTESMARAQAQVEQSQRQLDEMRKELTALQGQLAQRASTAAAPISPGPSPSASPPAEGESSSAATSAAIKQVGERQSMQDSQIAIQEQTKVESESKYPVKVTGLVLFNAFVNTRAVDMPVTPTLALPGGGSTGASVRQTVLGFDARGPHLFGARSYADLRVDFDGSPQPAIPNAATNYTGYYNANTTFLRLRTAHAALQWNRTEAYFSLDRPIFSVETPTSLTAVAIPALAWSGNLWTWNPQLGVTQDLGLGASRSLRLQTALIDVGDAPLSPIVSNAAATAGTVNPSAAEQSRWPGVEARIAVLGSKVNDHSSHFGVGGYFSPHHTALGYNYDAWAGTLDAGLALPAHLQLTGSVYRGLALGGLGGGAYKDFAYRNDGTNAYFRPLDDVGGWIQLKERPTERIEFNAAFGLDNAFARELRRYAVLGGAMDQNLARNHTYTGNVIYSPSSYLMFSLEYRHLQSIPVIGSAASSNIIGLGAGYKF
ncbi:MAG: hypothetical protein JWM54_660 [Acidobacteriaceae bacterium]|nr:hypothetical protein [Acidobacteriaceae bacterium]